MRNNNANNSNHTNYDDYSSPNYEVKVNQNRNVDVNNQIANQRPLIQSQWHVLQMCSSSTKYKKLDYYDRLVGNITSGDVLVVLSNSVLITVDTKVCMYIFTYL
jgi:hypothetical protein